MKTQLLSILLIISMILVACGTDNSDVNSQLSELTDVNVQLNWTHVYSVSPLHSAVNEGFFANEGLNVTLITGGFSEGNEYIDPFIQVLNSEAMFGIASSYEIIQARDAGSPVVAIMTVMQRSPSVILSLAETGIQRPQDLEGLTVLVGAADILAVNLLLETQGVDPEAVNIVPRTSFDIDDLLNREVDATTAWIVNEGVAVTESGNTPNYLVLSDYGIDAYPTTIFTTEDIINNNPDLVQSFVTAVASSLDFVVLNASEAIQHTLAFNPDLDEDSQLRRLNAMIPLISESSANAGFMNAEVWELNANLLRDNGLISNDFDASSAYSIHFINAVSDDS